MSNEIEGATFKLTIDEKGFYGQTEEQRAGAERVAKCYCGRKHASSIKLPFYKAMHDKQFDEYYCGHSGWN